VGKVSLSTAIRYEGADIAAPKPVRLVLRFSQNRSRLLGAEEEEMKEDEDDESRLLFSDEESELDILAAGEEVEGPFDEGEEVEGPFDEGLL
jgi:hypothetical protein